MIIPPELMSFIRESNRIENIHREPTQDEIDAHDYILNLEKLNVEVLEKFVRLVQPDATLRINENMNVSIGDHMPPRGGAHIRSILETILAFAYPTPEHAYSTHLQYESLHPFMDGNGRSGRVLWLWQMQGNAPAVSCIISIIKPYNMGKGNIMSKSIEETVKELITKEEARLNATFNESGLADNSFDGLVQYIIYGVPTGSFLEAVLSNDLKEACGKADSQNRHILFNYVKWLYNYAPSVAWGNAKRYTDWVTVGGLRGSYTKNLIDAVKEAYKNMDERYE